ncbi:hypothetical protein ACI2US_03095 [Ralstonia nicotianae]
MTMHICINCKHHRKEGSLGIRCWSGVIERIVRDPVTGNTGTVRDHEPVRCYEKRHAHPDTCPDYKEQE